MRIWHKNLIPSLCQKHICAMWREGLICYYGILENKPSWKNHPARKEFENCPDKLYKRLCYVSEEMLKRGYHPNIKLLKEFNKTCKEPKEWQTLEQQIEILKEKSKTIKNCNCYEKINK